MINSSDNIDPQARGFKNGSYLKRQITILSESEALLTDKLTGDEKKAFLSFVNSSDIILGESELDSFMVGFRLGAWFILDTFVYNDMPYEDFLKEEIKVQSLIQFSDSLAAWKPRGCKSILRGAFHRQGVQNFIIYSAFMHNSQNHTL